MKLLLLSSRTCCFTRHLLQPSSERLTVSPTTARLYCRLPSWNTPVILWLQIFTSAMTASKNLPFGLYIHILSLLILQEVEGHKALDLYRMYLFQVCSAFCSIAWTKSPTGGDQLTSLLLSTKSSVDTTAKLTLDLKSSGTALCLCWHTGKRPCDFSSALVMDS